MRVTEKQVAQNRAALVDTAMRLMQERGFDGAGVVDISREAGLTQGALYGQFGCKDVLAAAAVRKAFADGTASWREIGRTAPDPLRAYLDAYLSDSHLADVGSGCVLAACLSEVRRQDPAIGAAFTEGFAQMVALVQELLPPGASDADARGRALAMLSGMIGGMAIARALAPTDPAFAGEIIAATRGALERLATVAPPTPD